MMLAYEVINPSDPIIMDAPDHRSAAAACVLVGSGRLALEPRDGSDAPPVPLLMFGDPDEWSMGAFGQSFAEFLAVTRAAPANTITALRSFRLEGGRERSSLNDIVAHAHAWADRLEAEAPT